MKGAPLTKHEKVDQVAITVRAVDERGKEIERKWGIGRLASLVPLDVADRYRAQQRKFNAAVWEYEPEQVRKHGEAMLRAYDKLDELATAAGHRHGPVEQWEFQANGQLVVLVQDIASTSRVDLQGREARVWSLEEIANVIERHPILIAAKDAFPGATVHPDRPSREAQQRLDDLAMDIPF
jgi:hypothetical protein